MSPISKFRHQHPTIVTNIYVAVELTSDIEIRPEVTHSKFLPSLPVVELRPEVNDIFSDRDADWESLSFNHEYFERSRNNMLPKKCREICKKDPKERNHEEVMALRSYMVGLRSFELYSPKMQIALCRVVRFEAFGRGRIIVRIGAKGTSMYFIR